MKHMSVITQTNFYEVALPYLQYCLFERPCFDAKQINSIEDHKFWYIVCMSSDSNVMLHMYL